MKRLLLVMALVLVGCKRDDGGAVAGGGAAPPGPAQVAGNWQGTITFGQQQVAAGMALTQSGSSVGGAWTTATQAGTVAGTVSDTTLSFNLTQVMPCTGNYAGSGQVEGNSMTVVYSGSGCNGPVNVTGEFSR